GRSHWPDLLQQGWCLPGNMKYCSHETHRPHRNVTTMTSDSSELAIVRSNFGFIIPRCGARCRDPGTQPELRNASRTTQVPDIGVGREVVRCPGTGERTRNNSVISDTSERRDAG